jgi:hypothetical protein
VSILLPRRSLQRTAWEALRSAWFRAPTLFGHSPTVTRIRLAPDWRPGDRVPDRVDHETVHSNNADATVRTTSSASCGPGRTLFARGPPRPGEWCRERRRDAGPACHDDIRAGARSERLGFRVPSGGLYSTVGDLAKLVSMELGFGPQGAAPENSDASRRCAGCRLSESGLRVWAWLSGASMGRHGCNGTFRQPGRLHVDAALRQRARVWGHRAAPRGGWQSRRRPASRSGFP